MGVIKDMYQDILDAKELFNETDYFEKLYYEVAGLEQNYTIVMRKLFDTEFYSLVNYDENRGSDGLEIREKFEGNLVGPARLLEVMLGISARLDYALSRDEAPYQESFWEIFCNLGLDKLTDCDFCTKWMPADLNEIVEKLLDRRYNFKGSGGFFPLKRTKNNQTEVEIWYQMQEYLMENYPK